MVTQAKFLSAIGHDDTVLKIRIGNDADRRWAGFPFHLKCAGSRHCGEVGDGTLLGDDVVIAADGGAVATCEQGGSNYEGEKGGSVLGSVHLEVRCGVARFWIQKYSW